MARKIEQPSGAPYSHLALKNEMRQRESLNAAFRLLRDSGSIDVPVRETIITGHETDLPAGVYLFKEKDIAYATEKGVRATMDRRRRRESGMADSAHGVVAVNIDWKSPKDGDRHVHVAAKVVKNRTPQERMERTLREIRWTSLMKSAGKLNFEPHMLIVNDQKESVMFSEFIDGLYTLDNNRWERGFTNENMRLVNTASEVLGELDGMGCRHGDGKIKNNAEDSASNKKGMIDFETSISFDVNNPQEVRETVSQDFGLFLKSLDDRGFFTSQAANQRSINHRDVLDNITEKYLEGWAKSHKMSSQIEVAILSAALDEIEQLQDTVDAVRKLQTANTYSPQYSIKSDTKK